MHVKYIFERGVPILAIPAMIRHDISNLLGTYGKDAEKKAIPNERDPPRKVVLPNKNAIDNSI